MVCEDIAGTGVMGRPEEYFLAWNRTLGGRWRELFALVIERGTTANGVFGLKLMANQLSNLNACLGTFVQPAHSRAYPNVVAAFPSPIWIWVRRRDILDQAISHYVAQETGVYHAVRNMTGFVPGNAVTEAGIAKTTGPRVQYDFERIMHEWHVLQRGNLVWQSFFQLNSIDPIVVEYEYAVSEAGRREYLDRIADKLCVTAGELTSRNLVKLGTELNIDLRTRLQLDLLRRC